MQITRSPTMGRDKIDKVYRVSLGAISPSLPELRLILPARVGMFKSKPCAYCRCYGLKCWTIQHSEKLNRGRGGQ